MGRFGRRARAADRTEETPSSAGGQDECAVLGDIVAQRLTPDISLVIDAGYNPWTFGDNRKFKFWLLQPEVRHWFGCRSEGHFLGVHFLYAGFNVGGVKFLGMADRRYEGSLYGAGVAYGYRWPVGKRWSVEATAALGYLRSDYERYVWKRCGRYLGRGHKNYFGPTKIGVSFCFAIE